MRIGKTKKASMVTNPAEKSNIHNQGHDKENLKPKEFGWHSRDDSINTEMLSESF